MCCRIVQCLLWLDLGLDLRVLLEWCVCACVYVCVRVCMSVAVFIYIQLWNTFTSINTHHIQKYFLKKARTHWGGGTIWKKVSGTGAPWRPPVMDCTTKKKNRYNRLHSCAHTQFWLVCVGGREGGKRESERGGPCVSVRAWGYLSVWSCGITYADFHVQRHINTQAHNQTHTHVCVFKCRMQRIALR